MYEKFFKRILDVVLSALALILLLPILMILMIAGAIAMKGNPFFVQPRPGKIGKDGREKIFNLIKFRSMSDKRDSEGELLPDEIRLNRYGKFLRSTSLDELPELWNIIKGDMSIVGPRPLLVKYLPRYSPQQRRRHEVRPGLTGLAQIMGRNVLNWEEKFMYDVEYIDQITFLGDVRIILGTVNAVFAHRGISSETSVTMEEFLGSEAEMTIHE